jgi:sulfur carrier protein
MNIIVNGENIETPENITVEQLIQQLELQNKRLAVEVNEELVIRAEYSEHVLQTEDKVEIVQAIGGG